MKYLVTVKEVYIQDFIVEANSKKEAIIKCNNDEDCEVVDDTFEYSHREPDTNWDVEKVEES